MSLVAMDSQSSNSQVQRMAELTDKFDRQVDQLLKIQRKVLLLKEDFQTLRKSATKTVKKLHQISIAESEGSPTSAEERIPQEEESLNKIVQKLEEVTLRLKELAKKSGA